jgi:hypothetical protein
VLDLGGTDTDIPRSSAAAIRMRRDLRTVEQLYREWTVGLQGCLSILDMASAGRDTTDTCIRGYQYPRIYIRIQRILLSLIFSDLTNISD